MLQGHGIGAIAQGHGRVGVGFHEQTGHTHGHRCTGQYRHHFALAAAAGALAAGQLHAVCGIEHHGRTRLAHDGQRAHVGHQVVVAKAGTALAGHEVVIGQPCFACSGAGLVDDVFHVVRSQKLPLLDVHRLAALGHSTDEIGLAAQKSWGLQHIDHRSRRRDVVFGVYIGQREHAEFTLDFGHDFQPLFTARAAKAGSGRAVGLVEAAFENERDAQPGRDFFQRARRVHLQLLGLDHAWPGNQEKRLVQPDVKTAEFHSGAPVGVVWRVSAW